MATKATYMVDDPAAPRARNEDLEQHIRQKPDDESVYLVYADWLTTNGDPRGELAMVQHQLASTPTGERHSTLREREKEILKANGDFLGGVSAEVATATWHLGMWKQLRINNVADWMDSAFEARAIARRLFDLPQASCLQELALGVLRWEYQAQDLPAVLEEASRSAFARTLRRLRLGDVVGEDIDNAHHTIGDIGIVSIAFPRLESLTVWGYEIAASAPFDLPELRELAIQTCAMNRELFQRVLDAKLPKLQKLALWFGSANYGCQLGADDLRPLLEGSAFPNVKHLGLQNAEFTDAIAAVVLDSKILVHLETLDLSMGILTDDGARVLLDNAAQWKHLHTLDVSDNYLSQGILEELGRVGPKIASDSQKDDEGDPDYRYASISE